MLLNITYNFGNHRTVTKRLNFTGHAEYILSLSAEELKTVDLLYYHEPNKDELFAIQNLRGFVRSLQNSKVQSTPRDSSNFIFPFLEEVGDMSENVRAAIFEIGSALRIREDNDDSGGGECMCDWEYRTRCTCGFEENSNTDAVAESDDYCNAEKICPDCGELEMDCECPNLDDGHGDTPQNLLCYGDDWCICGNCTPYLYPAITPKPYEVDTNLLADADYFRKQARERVLSDLNSTFAEMIEAGDNQITSVFYSWVIEVLREKGYDVQVLEEWQCSEELWAAAEDLNKVPAIVFLTGRN